MTLVARQQMVQQRVQQIANEQGLPLDKAFMLFSYSYVAGRSLYNLDSTEMVDGGQDKQIDVIGFDEGTNSAVVYILQTKYTQSFATNGLVGMRNGLHWVIDKDLSDVRHLSNEKLRDKIVAFRELIDELGPMSVHIVVAYVTNGQTSAIAPEFREEEKTLRDEFDNEQFASFELYIWGADELIDEVYAAELSHKKVDVDLPIRYDRNIGSLIDYSATNQGDVDTQHLSGFICTARGQDVATIVNRYRNARNAIFEPNIRHFLGKNSRVNAEILDTCTNPATSRHFWFLNNGITIVCDDFERILNSNPPRIRIKNFQIVNGCQTAETLAAAARSYKKPLCADTEVLLRIYKAPNVDLTQRITTTTNSQNIVKAGVLKANDRSQRDLQDQFLRYGLYYERKPHQYDREKEKKTIDKSQIIPNSLIAQCYVAIVLQRPVIARRKNIAFWEDEWYDRIFAPSPVEPYILAWLICRQTASWLGALEPAKRQSSVQRKVAASATFHIGTIAAALWRNEEAFKADPKRMEQDVRELLANAEALNPFIERAYERLCELIERDERYKNDVDAALKKTSLEEDIRNLLRAFEAQRKVNHPATG